MNGIKRMCDFFKPKTFINFWVFLGVMYAGLIGIAIICQSLIASPGVPNAPDDVPYWRGTVEDRLDSIDEDIKCTRSISDQKLTELTTSINLMNVRLTVMESRISDITKIVLALTGLSAAVGGAGAVGTYKGMKKKPDDNNA